MDALGSVSTTPDRTLPAKDVVADYYRRYEEHYDLHVHRPVDVRSVFNRGMDLVVAYDGGELDHGCRRQRHGHLGRPVRPLVPRAGHVRRPPPAHRRLHSPHPTSRDKDVVVVGGGTSAIGFLLELENVAAHLVWVTRRPDRSSATRANSTSRPASPPSPCRTRRPAPAAPSPSIVSGTGVPVTRRIHAAIERGLLVPRPMFSAIEPDGVRWPDGSFERADAILWATGFRPELRHLAPLKLREKEGGVTVGGGASWKDPRIFFAGYGPQASTIGANRAGRRIARQVVAPAQQPLARNSPGSPAVPPAAGRRPPAFVYGARPTRRPPASPSPSRRDASRA